MVTTAPRAVPTQAAPAAAAPSTGRPRRRLHSLDGLRFLAAVGVMLYHFTAMWSTSWDTSPGEIFPGLGGAMIYLTLAPELFFVVSGFVILWTAWGRSVPAVVASRLARLYPPYWAALLLTSVLLLVIWPAGKDVSLGEALVNTTLLQEALGVRHVDGVYWTLWAELRFYALITVLVAVGLTRRRVVVVAALWPPVALVAERLGWETASMLLISRYAPYFAGGMLLFLIFCDGHRRGLWALVSGNVLLALHTTVDVTVSTIAEVTVFEADPRLVATAVVATFGGVALLTMSPLSRISWGVLPGLGAITYGVYLVHQFWGLWVIHLLHEHLPPYVTLVAAVTVSLALAVLVHHAVEKPLNAPVRRGLERVLTRAGRHRTSRRVSTSAQQPGPPRAPAQTA
jgi:peptidoglycan/LPS O-acetylase OafA/YrhL